MEVDNVFAARQNYASVSYRLKFTPIETDEVGKLYAERIKPANDDDVHSTYQVTTTKTTHWFE
jgi:hypothetical protein